MISVTNLRIVTTVLFGVAQLATCARIGFRFKRHRLWFDDVIASLAVVCSVVGLVYFWMNMTEDVGPLAWSEMSRTRSSWVVNGMFPSVIWSSRLAILFSMIRVLPYNLRGLPYAAGSAFVMMWSAILALTVTMSCNPGDHLVLFDLPNPEILVELASALFLIVSPAVISARLPADTAVIQHGTVASIAVVGFFSLAGSISHTTFFVQSKGNLEQLTVATALLFTSLPAFVVIVYRSPELDLDDPSHTGSALPLGRWRFSAAS
ncbi:hypothetical protein MPER_10532 [Moniliophthora perniciosa FA553]|nr:hypothetical protein MPER_10532 [Moniliophthora perniciosa FA553]